MARPLRLEFAGALYHVTARGDRREPIYEDDEDRQAFLDVLADVADRFNWLVHAYCEITNHYHLLIETPDGNLSKGMRQLNGVYTQYSNRRHGRVGHLFQGRYKAILVQKEAYLLEVARYIVLNPVRADMTRSAGDWPWSSYRATAGRAGVPSFLTTEWILSTFGERLKESQLAYRRFVSEGRGQPAPWAALANQVLLGDDAFVDRMRSKLEQSNRSLAEVPRVQRAGRARPLAEYAAQSNTRNEAIAAAYASGGYSMVEIGAHFGVHYSTVSRIVWAAERVS
ncbi:toxin RelE [Salinisphaera orenii MK-B5]|uniref:Toxin RelE n=1 Tax=Salinisphaera orenii MK-B5 TaxID=856730 RepID=A0A423PLW4_9GAMM|nr:transposase [Salinisphaera orenii]ROO26491.1 toxin RelE [Salinisphaera orenii MK-B5]